jgi:hypothetical protein
MKRTHKRIPLQFQDDLTCKPIPYRKSMHGIFHGLWDLYSHSIEVAELVLPGLLHDSNPEIRAGALLGLRHVKKAARAHLHEYRDAARQSNALVRDAGVRGLGASRSAADEKLLWDSLWNDGVTEIKFGAAYSIRDMLRQISVAKYREAVAQHKIYRIRVILAERAMRDRRLYDVARSAIQSAYRALKTNHVLNEGDERLLRKLRIRAAK